MDAFSERSRAVVQELTVPPGFRRKPWEPTTRDFSNFPYEVVAHTDKERESVLATITMKFQVAHDQIAYVPSPLENYIQPEHLCSENDSDRMKIARKIFWSHIMSEERERLEESYPDEYKELDLQVRAMARQRSLDKKLAYFKAMGPEMAMRLGEASVRRDRDFPMMRTKDAVINGIMLSVLFLCSGLAILLIGKSAQQALIRQIGRNIFIGFKQLK